MTTSSNCRLSDRSFSSSTCNEYDYINFLVATPSRYSCLEAARVQPEDDNPPSHDAINRLLYRLSPDSEKLWLEAQAFVELSRWILVIDETQLNGEVRAENSEIFHFTDFPA